MQAVGHSMIGVKHEENQDGYTIITNENSGLFLVADGMGGHKGGHTASKIAVDIISEVGQKLDAEKVLQQIEKANTVILEKSTEDEKLSGMGTTLALLLVGEEKADIIHIGDSRVYLFRENIVTALTKDHSLVQELVDKGELTEQEAKRDSRKNIITKALGVQPVATPDHVRLALKPGDVFLVCSDGVINVMDEQVMAQMVLDVEFEESAKSVCEKALELGSTDDITAIVVKI